MSDQQGGPPDPNSEFQDAQPQDPQLMGPAERALADDPLRPVRMRHPSGLWVLFITEMWERFSYYGMRALLVLFLSTASAEYVLQDGTLSQNTGFGWSEADAYTLYGVYTFMVYLTSIFGGIAADRYLGTHRSMLWGGWIIALGHITLAGAAFFGHEAGLPVTMATGPGAVAAFMTGLTLIIIGTGFFKPCCSVMVGQLYEQGDARRDSGFTIFYMGINLGAFLSPLVAGTLGENIGWHWGFGAAAVGMLLGLFFYQVYRPRHLKGVGEPPDVHWNARTVRGFLLVVGGLAAIPLVPLLLYVFDRLGPVVRIWGDVSGPLGVMGTAAVLTMIILGAATAFLMAQPGTERGPLAVILILAFLGNIFFWTAFEQAGSSMNYFAAHDTNRPFPLPEWARQFLRDAGLGTMTAALLIGAVMIVPLALRLRKRAEDGFLLTAAAWGLAGLGGGVFAIGVAKLVGQFTGTSPLDGLADMTIFPATWYQSVNALTIVICAPVFSAMWLWLARRNLNPSTPLKFSIGLWLLGLSFLAMVFGAMESQGDDLAGPHWLVITYVVYTWGELCLSPVGLSMVTKLAPQRLQSLMMGLWFFSLALSNLLAGLVAGFSVKIKDGEQTFLIEGLPGFYLMLVIFPIGAGVLILLLTPLLKRMMQGKG